MLAADEHATGRVANVGLKHLFRAVALEPPMSDPARAFDRGDEFDSEMAHYSYAKEMTAYNF